MSSAAVVIGALRVKINRKDKYIKVAGIISTRRERASSGIILYFDSSNRLKTEKKKKKFEGYFFII